MFTYLFGAGTNRTDHPVQNVPPVPFLLFLFLYARMDTPKFDPQKFSLGASRTRLSEPAKRYSPPRHRGGGWFIKGPLPGKWIWCSADPICRELAAQGLQGLNRAACHACALVSETSCVCSNVMLDRAVLVGDDSGMTGYFGKVAAAIEKSLAEGKKE